MPVGRDSGRARIQATTKGERNGSQPFDIGGALHRIVRNLVSKNVIIVFVVGNCLNDCFGIHDRTTPFVE
jgi:hypothetical protein